MATTIGRTGVSLLPSDVRLGRLMLSSFSMTCAPADAMKNSISTNTTSTMGAIWKPMSPSSEPTEPAIKEKGSGRDEPEVHFGVSLSTTEKVTLLILALPTASITPRKNEYCVRLSARMSTRVFALAFTRSASIGVRSAGVG